MRKVIVGGDEKGGAKDVASIKGLNYPVSLQRVQDVKEYLDTKVLHKSPVVMYEDLRHTKKFTDIPFKVLRTIVGYYHYNNGDVTATDIHKAVRSEFFTVDLNKKGANIGFIKLTKNQRARLDVLQSKEDISDLNEAENKEYEALVKLYRKTKEYKGNWKAKRGANISGFNYTIGGL